MRMEQAPQHLKSNGLADDNTLLKSNGLPPLPKANMFMSETTYFSSQPSQEPSDISSGVSSDRNSQNHVG